MKRTYNHHPVPKPGRYERSLTGLEAATYLLVHRPTFSGAENIPRSGPAVLAARHFSNLDIGVLASAVRRSVREQVHIMAKKELNKPVFGKALERRGAFFVDRDQTLQPGTLDYVENLVALDALIGVFPEGTRNKKNGPQGKLKRGVAGLAIRHGMPVVPVGIVGTAKGDRGPFGMGSHVHFGEPLYFGNNPEVFNVGPREFIGIVSEPMESLRLALLQAQEDAVTQRPRTPIQ